MNILNHRFTDKFFAACQQFYEYPLYRLIETGNKIRLMLWSDDPEALYEYLVAAASCGQISGHSLKIYICGSGASQVRELLEKQCPMYSALAEREAVEIEFSEVPEAFPPYVVCDRKFMAELKGPCVLSIGKGGLSEELERLAENLNYAYSVSYNDRGSFSEITADLKKDDDKKAANYASSVLQAAHIPVKMYIAGARESDTEEAVVSYQKAIEDPAVLNRLVYLEHLRWTVFMVLRGFRIPTDDEMKRVYKDDGSGNMLTSFRNDKEGIHPALARCSEKGIDALEGRSREFWEGYRPDNTDESYAGLDELSRMSLYQRYLAGEAVKQNREAVEKVLAEYPPYAPGILQLRNAVKGFDQTGEAGLKNALRIAEENGVSKDLQDSVEKYMQSSIDASRRRSYIQGDIYSVKAQGYVLLKRKLFRNVIRCMSADHAENIISLARLDPEKAAFIVPLGMDVNEQKDLEDSIREFAKQRRLATDIRLYFMMEPTVREVRKLLYEIHGWMDGKDGETVFDLTGAVPQLVMATADDPCGSFFCEGYKLVPFRGCRSISVMNAMPLNFKIEDIFAAMARRAVVGWDITDMRGIEKTIKAMLTAYISVTAGKKDLFTALREYIYPTKDNPRNRKYSQEKERKHFRYSVQMDIGHRRNIPGSLYRLASDGYVDELDIRVENGAYEISGSTDYSALIKQLFDIEGDSDSTYSAKYDNRSKKPVLRWIGDTFPMPEDKCLRMVVQEFEKAGCFTIDGDTVSFASPGMKSVFALGTDGIILEDALYFAVKENPNFKEVRLGYSFGKGDLSENEIDVVAITNAGRPVYISCKNGHALSIGAAHEIYRHARLYNINSPIPVLAATEPDLASKGFDVGGKARDYVEKGLGVTFIDRDILKDWNKLQDVLTRIATSGR